MAFNLFSNWFKNEINSDHSLGSKNDSQRIGDNSNSKIENDLETLNSTDLEENEEFYDITNDFESTRPLSLKETDEYSLEFITPPDPNEINISLSCLQTGENITKISGLNKKDLLKMSSLCKISYGNNDKELAKKGYKTKAELINEGYEIIPFFNDYETSPAGFVFKKGKEMTIAYHGTKGMNDIISDLNGLLTTSEFLPEGGRVHCGFYRAFKSSWKSLYTVLRKNAEEQKLEIKDLKINITGHSMGGALAKISALCLNKTENANDINVATFGDPRVFDLDASEIYNDVLAEKTIRVTQHGQDPVPAVMPGFSGYAHVGMQLRVPVLEQNLHRMDGYHKAMYVMQERDFQSSNDVSFFYHPSKLVSKLNCMVIGMVQNIFGNTRRYLSGESWVEQTKREYENSRNNSKIGL
ncbi:lipase family protein [Wolbachia endosymbiont of Chironomus riparius]|uniref:lipase family protein n=1 Tax=Wolbachia endosymbiont of Chironomus riparius TaxID=2883238 RepID=UPI00209D03ED|nr:lipase family protein [Wolbachia endosymbiont of Chironomus riparius]